MSNNAAEREIRAIAIGRKNWTFAGSDDGGRRAAAIYTLIETAKLNDVDPQAWLADVLARLQDHPAKRIDELLPWNWKTRAPAKGRRVDERPITQSPCQRSPPRPSPDAYGPCYLFNPSDALRGPQLAGDWSRGRAGGIQDTNPFAASSVVGSRSSCGGRWQVVVRLFGNRALAR